MDISASIKYARISSQKSILVANQIKGLSVNDALNILTFSVKKASGIIKKLLESAVANAKYRNKLYSEELKINNIIISKAPSLKRTKCMAKGKGTRIVKRNCHIYIYINKL